MWEWVLVAGVLGGIYALSQPYLTWRRRRQDQMYWTHRQLVEVDVSGQKALDIRDEWPLTQTARCALSLVVPAFNEEKRIGVMLYESIDFLDNFKLTHPAFSYEILVVDDGSKDQTVKVALDIARVRCANLRVISCKPNGGKGCAVRIGVLYSFGANILFADADGATDIRGLEGLLEEMEVRDDCGVAVGSRNKARGTADISVLFTQRKRYRDILGKLFVFGVTLLCGVPVTVLCM
jgi:cellulose synthase/poly-beta-1,6-N-acetylglucosamine synthase-like glycosyltransferase